MALLTIIILQQLLSATQLSEWGWRIPFLMGAMGAVVVFYLRRGMVETASKKSMNREGAGTLGALMQHKRAVVLTLIFTIGGSLYFYTFTTYMQKFLVLSGVVDTRTASVVMGISLVVFMVMQPIFGALSDRLGIRTHMRVFTGLAAIFVVPILFGIQASRDPWIAGMLVVAGLTIAAFYTPIAGLLKADMFPVEIRALGVGFPYAIGNALFGGTAEYVALRLREANIESTYFYYVAVVCVIAFIAALVMPDLRKKGYLDGAGQV